jgi:deoxyribonuclease-4
MTDNRPLPPIGAQVSSAGGFPPVPQRAADIGAEAVQIFNTNPRVWRPRVPSPGEIEALVAGLRAHRLRLFFHSSYLINLASPDPELRRRSREALAFALSTGAAVGAEAVIVHIGSHRGEAAGAERRVVRSIARSIRRAERVLAAGQEGVPAASVLPALLLETGSGGRNTIGGRLEDLLTLLSLEEAEGLGRELPLGICIDTAHLFAAGYAVHEEKGLEDLIERLRALGLLERVRLVHLNDSKTPLGARRDQHENLGQGLIGYDGLSRLVRHAALRHVPFILEVPGIEGHGPDAVNIAVAKSMRRG